RVWSNPCCLHPRMSDLQQFQSVAFSSHFSSASFLIFLRSSVAIAGISVPIIAGGKKESNHFHENLFIPLQIFSIQKIGAHLRQRVKQIISFRSTAVNLGRYSFSVSRPL